MTYDICIIGAGVMGLSIAHKLSQYELTVCVIDKGSDVASGVSKANSGIIHGGFDDATGTVKAKYSIHGHNAIKTLNKSLHFGYKPIGSLVLAFSPLEEEIIKKLYQNAKTRGIQELSLLSREEILHREPHIHAHVSMALLSKNSGIISPYEFAIALADNSLDNDVHIKLSQEVMSIQKDALYTIRTNKENICAKILINCAGLYCDDISAMVGVKDYTITPIKGQYLILDREAGTLIQSVLFRVPSNKGKGILISPTYHGNLLLGPDAQPCEKSDTSTDLESLKNIYIAAQKTVKNIPIKKIITNYAGVRPNNSTGDFIIREKISGFIECAGMKSPGLTSCLPIADSILTTYIANHFKLVKKHGYKKERPTCIPSQADKVFLSIQKTNELASLNLDNDECMICKCEQVRKKVIAQTIAHSKFDLISTDAIKMRTRAGMGYCQGAFCKSRVENIIISHYSTIRKNRKKSKRVTRKELLDYLKELEIPIL